MILIWAQSHGLSPLTWNKFSFVQENPTPDIEAHLQISSELVEIQSFKEQPHKMVKHTKTIRQFDKLFECVCPFCGIGP